MKDVERYLALPWTVRTEVRKDDGEYLSLTIDELPEFVVAGRPGEELSTQFWEALEDYLQSFLDDNETVPLPEGCCDAGGVEETSVIWPAWSGKKRAVGGVGVPRVKESPDSETVTFQVPVPA